MVHGTCLILEILKYLTDLLHYIYNTATRYIFFLKKNVTAYKREQRQVRFIVKKLSLLAVSVMSVAFLLVVLFF